MPADSAAIVQVNAALCATLAVALVLLRRHRWLPRAMGLAGFLAAASLAALLGVGGARLFGEWALLAVPPVAVLFSALLVFNVVMRSRALAGRWFLVGVGCCAFAGLCLEALLRV